MRVFPRTLGITALLLTPAFHAAMAQEPAPAAIEPPPATTPAPAAAAPGASMGAGTGAFGSQGQIAISVDLPFMNEGPQLAIVHESSSMGGGSSTKIGIQPSLDYFVAPHVSVGGQVGIGHGSTGLSVGGSSINQTVIGVEVRGGYELPLTDSVSLWPRLGIGYNHTSYSGGGGADSSGYDLDLLVSVPVLWHPASHFFIGAGPALTTQLVNKVEGMSQPKTTDIGLTALIGGYFGGT
jgi:opacity protein-like surface antigen